MKHNNHSFFFSIILLLVLSTLGCTPSESAVQTSIANTQISLPSLTPTIIPSLTSTPIPTITPTPTPISLSKLNLEEILLIKGDLPEGFETKPIRGDTDNPVLVNISGYENFIIQEFSKTNEGIGIVAIYLFNEATIRDKAYNNAKKVLDETKLETIGTSKQSSAHDFGEKGIFYYDSFGIITVSKIIFVRCNAFVYMARSMDIENQSVLRAYAMKLDKRLTQLLCP